MQILEFAAWIINISFAASLIPQVVLNFRLKTTRGLSDFMLFCYFAGYISYSYYVFCMGLPFSYKSMVLLSFLFVLIMVAQRFIYDVRRRCKFLPFYLISSFVGIVFLPLSFSYPHFVGMSMGWVQFLIWIFYQTPQITKIYLKKSVYGFSFLLVSLIALGEFIEVLIAVGMKFPVQTICNGCRGMLFYFIFCFLFYRYHKKTEKFFGAKKTTHYVVPEEKTCLIENR